MEIPYGLIRDLLNQVGWQGKPCSKDELLGKCPFHDDHSPSFRVHLGNNWYKCWASHCAVEGGINDLCDRFKLPNPLKKQTKHIEGLDLLTSNLFSSDGQEALAILLARGLTTETIKKFRLGVTFKLGYSERSPTYRIMVPVFNQNGNLLFCRRYHPAARTWNPDSIEALENSELKTDTIKASTTKQNWFNGECPICKFVLEFSKDSVETITTCQKCNEKIKIRGQLKGKIVSPQGGTKQLFNAHALKGLDAGSIVYITEGEWDCMMMVQNGFNAVTGTSGSRTWDASWSPLLDAMDVVLLLDDDPSGVAGANVVRDFLQRRGMIARLRTAKWPFRAEERLPGNKKPKDANDWFLLGHTAEEVTEFVGRSESWAIPGPPSVPRDIVIASGGGGEDGSAGATNKIADIIDEIRDQKLKRHRMNQRVWLVVMKHLLTEGRFAHIKNTKLTYYFSHKERRLHALVDEEFAAYLIETYRLNPTEPEFKYVEKEMMGYAKRRGDRVTVRRFCYYDRTKNAVYISQHDGNVVKITEEQIEIVNNGVDGIMFMDNDDLSDPWKLPDQADWITDQVDAVAELNKYTSDISFDSSRGAVDVQSKILLLWVLSLFFGSAMKARPLCAFLGLKGSGKTMAFRRLLQLFYGPDADVTSIRKDSKDDIQAAIMSSYLVVFDNIDGDEEISEELAKACTGQVITRRELYTTLKASKFKPDCFVGITANDPKFTKSDIIDRMIPFRLIRREEFGIEPIVLPEDRSRFFSAACKLIQLILENVRKDLRPKKLPYRLADWSTWAFLCGVSIGWPNDEVANLMETTESMRLDLQGEEDQLIDLIGRWLTKIDIKTIVDDKRVFKSAEICKAVNELLYQDGETKFKYSPKWIGRKIKDCLPALKRKWFVHLDHDKEHNIDTFEFGPLSNGHTQKSKPRPHQDDPLIAVAKSTVPPPKVIDLSGPDAPEEF